MSFFTFIIVFSKFFILFFISSLVDVPLTAPQINFTLEKTTKNQNILRKCFYVVSIKSKLSKKKSYQLVVIKSDTV